MAYVPPHKRSVKDEEEPLRPSSIMDKFDQQLTLGTSGTSGSRKTLIRKAERREYIPGYRYTVDTISRLLLVGLIGNNQFPSLVELMKRYPCESYERKMGQEFYAFMNSRVLVNDTRPPPLAEDPWLYIAEKIHKDVLTAFQNVRSIMERDGSGDIGPSLVVRLGKILFYGKGAPLNLDLIRDGLVCWSSVKGLKKLFFTSVPDAYIEHVENKIAMNGELGSLKKKEEFTIKIVDNQRPGHILTCKCARKDDTKLELLKLETDICRHLVVDMPLLLKPIDVRLMLYTKNLVELTDKEKDCIYKIVGAASIDPNVKGGLRWPLGKDSVAKFHVQEFHHLKGKVYNSSMMKVTLRYADRFDLQTSLGKTGCEVTCKLTELKRYLKEDVGDDAELATTLKESLRFIWHNLLNWDGEVDME